MDGRVGLQHARPELDITLVESSDVPTVGVGEATLNSFHSFLLSVGLHEDEFLHAVGGTLKLGIRYHGWSARDYWHPFGEVMFPRPFLDRWMADPRPVRAHASTSRSTSTRGSAPGTSRARTACRSTSAIPSTTPAPCCTGTTWTRGVSPRC